MNQRLSLLCGARGSLLSRAQLKEVEEELFAIGIDRQFEPLWVETIGDRDKKTSLRTLDKTDFFTREIDDLLLAGRVRVAIHSAKDLPSPLRRGLSIAALTRGKDPRDSLVLKPGVLPKKPHIATSSERREEAVRGLYPDAVFSDLRGTIQERLSLVDLGEVDGVVVAEAALIRLGLTHLHRVSLPGPTAQLQGKLAIVIREGDDEMRLLFRDLHDPLPWH